MGAVLLFCCVAAFEGVLYARGQDCRPGEYQTDKGVCCPMCGRGTVVKRHCTLSSSILCRPCESGTFMDLANGLHSCFPCRSCDSGLVISKNCTTESNTLCDVDTGYYCLDYSLDSDCSHAVRHTHCGPGQSTKSEGTKTSDTVCEDCLHGSYSQLGVNCSLWTSCKEEHMVIKHGTSTSDVVCGKAMSRHHFTLLIPFLLLALPFVACIAQVVKKKDVKISVEESRQFSSSKHDEPT